MNPSAWLRAVGQGLKDYWRILTLGLVWLALFAGLVISGLGDIARAKADTGACRPYKVEGVPSRPPKQPARAKKIRFFSRRRTKSRRSGNGAS